MPLFGRLHVRNIEPISIFIRGMKTWIAEILFVSMGRLINLLLLSTRVLLCIMAVTLSCVILLSSVMSTWLMSPERLRNRWL